MSRATANSSSYSSRRPKSPLSLYVCYDTPPPKPPRSMFKKKQKQMAHSLPPSLKPSSSVTFRNPFRRRDTKRDTIAIEHSSASSSSSDLDPGFVPARPGKAAQILGADTPVEWESSIPIIPADAECDSLYYTESISSIPPMEFAPPSPPHKPKKSNIDPPPLSLAPDDNIELSFIEHHDMHTQPALGTNADVDWDNAIDDIPHQNIERTRREWDGELNRYDIQVVLMRLRTLKA